MRPSATYATLAVLALVAVVAIVLVVAGMGRTTITFDNDPQHQLHTFR